MKRFREGAAEIAALLKEAWFVFWKVKKEDEAGAVAGKVFQTVSKGAAYSFSDNLLTALSPVTVGFFKWLGWGDLEITLVMWVEDVLIAYGMILFSRNVIQDFTLTEAIRASIDSVRRGRIGQIVANILTAVFLFRFSLWDGPERVAIFFDKELPKNSQKLFVVMIFSVIQAVFWTKLYSLGIDGLVNMWRLFF
jgi:hypothetical protein